MGLGISKIAKAMTFPRCIEVCRDELKPKDMEDTQAVEVCCKGCPKFDRRMKFESNDDMGFNRKKVVKYNDNYDLNLRVELL